MKFIIIILLAAFSFTFVNSSIISSTFNNCEDGNGEVISQERSPGIFSSVSSSITADITIEKANTNKVSIVVDENLQDNIHLKVENGVLKITSDKCYNTKQKAKITVQTPELKSVSMTGSGDLKWRDNFKTQKFTVNVSGAGDVSGVIDTEDLLVNVSGAGDVSLKGDARNQNIDISGAGDYLGEMIKGNSAEVKVSGAGSVNLGELKTLNAKVSGVGSIYYKGNPKVTRSVSGVGTVAKK